MTIQMKATKQDVFLVLLFMLFKVKATEEFFPIQDLTD